MKTRREFLKSATTGGIAGIVASGMLPTVAKAVGNGKEISLEEAAAVHKRCLIVDGHNDVPVERVARKENPLNWMQRDTSFHTDIPRMKGNGQQYTAFMIVGNGPTANVWITLERVQEQIDTYPKDIMKVLTSADAVRAGKTGRVGGHDVHRGRGPLAGGTDRDPAYFPSSRGVRSVGITHGGRGGATRLRCRARRVSIASAPWRSGERKDRRETIGLTPFGKEVLKAGK